MKLTRILLLSILTISLYGQDQPKPQPVTKQEVKAPELGKLITEYWKARSRQLAAAKDQVDADKAMNELVVKMQTACGPSAILSGDAQGDPTCLLKEAPKADEKTSTK